MRAEFVPVATRKEIREGRSKLVKVDGEPIALWQVGGEIYAINNICPHQHHSRLHEGTLEDGLYLRCPMHGWSFCLKDGLARSRNGKAKVYKVRIEGEKVLVERPE